MSDTKEKEMPMMEEEKLNDQMQVRREKMQEFIDAGVYPFGQKYNWDHHAQEVKDQAETLEKNETVVSVAGRLMAIRRHGKTAFCVLRDLSGEIQLYFRKDVLGEESYNLFKLLDLGDIVASAVRYSLPIPAKRRSALNRGSSCPNHSVRCRKNSMALRIRKRAIVSATSTHRQSGSHGYLRQAFENHQRHS